VEALAVKILAEKSKDARAMAFLAYSMLRKNDIGRLADVFCALANYCRDNFDDIFPQREGAKLAALRWLSEARFNSACPKAEASAGDAEDVGRMKEALSTLKSALEKRFSSVGAPFPLLLYKRVTEWEKGIESERLAKAAAEAKPEPSTLIQKGMDDRGNGGNDNNGGVDKPIKQSANQSTISISADEYAEIVRCMNKIMGILEGKVKI
jgi:predicted component of type VI protein secretion system